MTKYDEIEIDELVHIISINYSVKMESLSDYYFPCFQYILIHIYLL